MPVLLPDAHLRAATSRLWLREVVHADPPPWHVGPPARIRHLRIEVRIAGKRHHRPVHEKRVKLVYWIQRRHVSDPYVRAAVHLLLDALPVLHGHAAEYLRPHTLRAPDGQLARASRLKLAVYVDRLKQREALDADLKHDVGLLVAGSLGRNLVERGRERHAVSRLYQYSCKKRQHSKASTRFHGRLTSRRSGTRSSSCTSRQASRT